MRWMEDAIFDYVSSRRQISDEKKMQKNMAAKAAGRACRVFLTPTAAKYTAATYKIVSDEPSRTDAAFPAKLSGP